MTREEMLQQMGISDGDFNDYLNKLLAFRDSLNPQQLQLFNRSRVSFDQVAQAFGPGASTSDVEALFAQAPSADGTALVSWGGPPHKHS